MLHASTNEQQSVGAETVRLREQIERLDAEVARLRSENRHLRAALDAHIARASSPSLYGPLELTAGTCVGPRRRRGRGTERRPTMRTGPF